jgi:hypothetical protein
MRQSEVVKSVIHMWTEVGAWEHFIEASCWLGGLYQLLKNEGKK